MAPPGAILSGMSRVASGVQHDVFERADFERAWHGVSRDGLIAPPVNKVKLTIARNGKSDFQDRQVYLFVDGEPWGKVKYGREVTGEIAPGRHRVRAFNTLFSHTIEIDALPGEHVRLRCTNSMPTAGWLMMIFLHVTALSVKLERE